MRYDANGGYGAPAVQTKNYQTNLILSKEEPSRDGRVFLGWATSQYADRAEYQPGDIYKTDADIVFYAVWEEKKPQSINISANISKTFGKDTSFELSPSGGTIKTDLQFKSSDTGIVSVESHGSYGTVMIKKPGKVKITITAPSTDYYESAEKVVTVKIYLANPKVRVTVKKNLMTVKWSKVRGAKKYKVSVMQNGVKETILTFKANKTSVSNTFTKGKKYIIKVRALDSSGKYASGWSKKTVRT